MGLCVNLQSDPANCSGCGKACATGVPCISGQCTGCPMGEVQCPSGCANLLEDAQNCGVCGNICMTLCLNGNCQ
jgi:hypothetical protein